jgi:hypothetical protein
VNALFRWGGRKAASPSSASVPDTAVADVVAVSKVLPRFLAALSHQSTPVLLDLGPVVGSNIAFFGDQLSCKIFVEDLFAEVEAQTKQGNRALAESLPKRLVQEPGTIDGILCWDLFDYLDKKTSPALAARLTDLLKPGGALYAFFGSTPSQLTTYTKFILEPGNKLRQRASPATPVQRHVLLTRDINKMFGGLRVAESVLLKSNTRETLFRKP